MQYPTIKTLESKTLAGLSADTTLASDDPAILWQQFMPRSRELTSVVGDELYAVQVYDAGFVQGKFTAESVFRKWAAIEVQNGFVLPAGIEQLILPKGMYAVFIHKGPASNFGATASYIYGEWLPASNYKLEDRPHFQVMGKKYLGHTHPDSEEEVWVPVKPC